MKLPREDQETIINYDAAGRMATVHTRDRAVMRQFDSLVNEFPEQYRLVRVSDIDKIYEIGFLDFTLFKDHPRFYSTYKLTETREHYVFSNKLSIGIVDLTRIALATPEDKRYNIDVWAKLFKAQTWEDIKMLAAQDVNISEAAATLYQLSADERIRQECEAREDYWKRQSGMEDLIAEQEKALAEKEKALAEQEKALAEQEKALAEKERTLAEKDAEIERLKALLAQKA